MKIVKNSIKISILINLQNNTDVIIGLCNAQCAGACVTHQQSVNCRAFLL